MILRMSIITFGLSVLTVILWFITKNRKLNTAGKIAVGIIYGLAACASTHWGVDYNSMVLNVRDIAPLSAGLFFGPLPGIIAGLIGGIERYIAGTYFGVGSYTRIACSLSTCLAGFLAAAFNKFMFKGKKSTPFYAMALGAVTEVFHMFVVLVTHRDDMDFALFVVDTCATPMIVFTALGMLLSSLTLWLLSSDRPSLHKPKRYEIPLTVRFQSWLVLSVIVMFIFTFAFSQTIQTRIIVQDMQQTMSQSILDTEESLSFMNDNISSANELVKKQGLDTAHAVARELEKSGGMENAASLDYPGLCELYGLYEIDIVDDSATVVYSSNPANIGFDMTSSEQSRAFVPILHGEAAELAQDFMSTGKVKELSLMYVGVSTDGGLVQIAYDSETIAEFLSIADISDVLETTHLGRTGTVYIVDSSNRIIAGEHEGEDMFELGYTSEREGTYYTADVFGTRSYCTFRQTGSYTIFAIVPEAELYNTIKSSGYETAFADILLFALIFLLIYILVQRIIVRNLNRINASLASITGGNLDEVVDVNTSTEFASLSRDINSTVDTLKMYIAEAENRINEELEFARSIQSAALPKVFSFPDRDEFDLYASMEPAKVIGGDFYDLFFAGPTSIALVIADVSGKGIPAALFMMRSKTALKSLAETGASPKEIFERANDVLCAGNDANMFVTAWIGIVDISTGVVRCANAGHEYPAIMRANGSFELFKDKHGLALAAMEGMPYTGYELKLNPGDKLFVYTDGVPEATNINDEQFGIDRMLDALNHVKNMPMSKILPFVRECISRFAGDADQFDDITMLGFALDHYMDTKNN